jgi:lipopolysaccharide exporter
LAVQTQSIYTRAIKGTVINGITSVIELLIGFGGSIVLARTLNPRDFGIFAFAFIFVAVFGAFSSFQTQSYVIQSREQVKRTMSAGFTVELVCAVVVVILVELASPLIFKALGRSDQVVLTQVFAVLILLQPFRVARAGFVKELRFLQVSIALLAGLVVGTSLKISLAIAGWGAWSLMIGTVAVVAVECAIVWGLTPVRPNLSFDREILPDVIRFGMPLVVTTLLLQVWSRMGDFMVGSVLSDYWLGVYYLAFRIPYFVMVLGQSVIQTAFPALSKAETKDQLTKGFRLTTKLTFMLFCMPVIVCVVWPSELIELLYGARWLPAASPFRIFTIVPLAHFTVIHFGDLYKTQGRTKEPMYVMLGQVVILAVLGYFLMKAFGLIGIAVALLVTELAPLPLIVWMVNRFVVINYISVLWRTALAAGASIVLGVMLREMAGGRILAVGLAAPIQWAFYLLIVIVLERKELERLMNELWELIRSRLS